MSNMVVQTNILALNSHRNLKNTGNSIAKASEKLSSGYRINRAADDAAGLAISEKMRSQIRGLDQASRNSQDGINLIQTAEGALQETEDMLQRMRELIVQASNDSNEQSDRDKIALELDELSKEIDATAEKTEFNKKKLIDGSWANKDLYFQTGANSGQGIQFGIAAMNAASLGVTIGSIGDVVRGGTTTAAAVSINIAAVGANAGSYNMGNGEGIEISKDGKITLTSDFQVGSTIYKKGTYSLADLDGVTLTAKNGSTVEFDSTSTNTEIIFTPTGFSTTAPAAIATTTAGTHTFKNGSKVIKAADDTYTFSGASNLKAFIQNADGTRTAINIEDGKVYTAADMKDVILESADEYGERRTFTAAGTGIQAGTVYAATIRFRAAEDPKGASNSDGKEISALTNKLDAAIESVSAQRAQLGAYQNRIEHTIKTVETSSENLNASESQIRNADMAKEMMSLTQFNILQQAATAMLAQANQAPQNLLTLLR